MSLYFWIFIGIAFAALVVGFILKLRLSDEQVWEELVDPNAQEEVPLSEAIRETNYAPRPDIPIDSHQHRKSDGEEMNTNPPLQTPRASKDADLRRSSRIERAVPLVVLATNRRGETFQERTSSVAVSLHGCRYSSRHDIAPEGWVTLQVTGTDGGSSTAVRARVRSILSSQTSRELCQVGVELETPGNVWGIPAPPEDWQRALGNGNSGVRAAAAVAPAAASSDPASTFIDRQPGSTDRRAEVTVFPGSPAAANAAPEISPAKDTSSGKAERVVVTAEQILQALQGKIQFAADKAVQASLSAQLDAAIKTTLGKIEDGSKTSVRQSEEFSAARLAEVQKLWEKELLAYRTRAEEISRRLEALTANSQQALADTQKYIARFAGETAPQIQAHLTDSLGHAKIEFEASAAEVSRRHLAQLNESTQLATREARSQLDGTIAEVRSLISTAGGTFSQDRLESLLNSFRAETSNHLEQRLAELYNGFQQQHDLVSNRTNDIEDQLEALALESHQLRAQHEQGLAEVRAVAAGANQGVPQQQLDTLLGSWKDDTLGLLELRLGELSSNFEKQHELARQRSSAIARELESSSKETLQALTQQEQSLADLRSLVSNTNAGVPQEQLDSVLNASREQVLSLLEWRLGEVSGRFDQLLGEAHHRDDALAQQLERISLETRAQLAETRNIAVHASREVQPQDLAAVEQSVAQATKEFETAAVRVSDRQILRLLEQKQALSQEVSLELEARVSEARSLLQRTANNTLEEFRRRVDTQIDQILVEANERLNSSLASLDAENRLAVETRRRTLETEVARAAEQSALEFRSGIKAFLYSCLVAAVSAVDQHAQTTLAGLSADPDNLQRALDASTESSASADNPSQPPKSASSSR
jgi:hypothetical protein